MVMAVWKMAVWKMAGDLRKETGLTTALGETGIVSAGTTNSFLHASHLTRIIHVNQVTILSLATQQLNVWRILKGQQAIRRCPCCVNGINVR